MWLCARGGGGGGGRVVVTAAVVVAAVRGGVRDRRGFSSRAFPATAGSLLVAVPFVSFLLL